MQESKVQFERKINKNGESIGNTIPKELVNYLELKEGDTIQMTGEKGKKGKYITFWKKQPENTQTE